MDAKLAFEVITKLIGHGNIPEHRLNILLECLILLEQDSYNRGIKSLIDKLKEDYEK